MLVFAVGVEDQLVLARCDERLIGERKHGGLAVVQMLDRRAERAAHSAGKLRIDRVADGQSVERRQGGLMLAPQHDQHLVEAGGENLSNGPPDERLVAKRQEELLRPILVDAPAASTTAVTIENSVAHPLTLAQ